ncbi:hypothetical protein HRbin02_01880 [Candidatus Calditenuaceae archaeon HR02]|nr:hypothetical protein HRbin02_01880 [Candidatus Calditenuaceae archaeon HR02]
MGKRYFRRDEIVGKDIISDSAIRLGKVKDIGYDAEGKIVLIYDKPGEGGEEAVPSSQIIAFGDVVLVKSSAIVKTPPMTSPSSEKVCPNCGKVNAPDMIYCTSCGSKLGG